MCKEAIKRMLQMQPGIGPYRLYDGIKGRLGGCTPAEAAALVLVASRARNPFVTLVNTLAGADFEALFGKFCEAGSRRWGWHDSRVNQVANGLSLLDGQAVEVECGVFADALIRLATLPRPLGLGLDESAFELVVCEGLHGEDGFVVDERRLPSFKIAPRCNDSDVINVFEPAEDGSGRLERTPYTLWGNHKIIRHDGKLWDPCYGARYGHVTDFIEYDIQGTGVFMPYCRGVNGRREEAYFLGAGVHGDRPRYLGPLNRDQLRSALQRGEIGRDQHAVGSLLK
ncbi:MAG TPA: hypothetical protein VF457_01350 [Burkholderiaceae bacterium]